MLMKLMCAKAKNQFYDVRNIQHFKVDLLKCISNEFHINSSSNKGEQHFCIFNTHMSSISEPSSFFNRKKKLSKTCIIP